MEETAAPKNQGGRPTRYAGKRSRSFALTDEAHDAVGLAAVVTGETKSDFVETLIRRHTSDVIRYLRGTKDADATTDSVADPAAPGVPDDRRDVRSDHGA